jgi:hypothetical protein
MSTITVSLPEKRLAELSEMADHLGVGPEELVRASVEDLLTRPEADFEQAMKHVLKESDELYRRLA